MILISYTPRFVSKPRSSAIATASVRFLACNFTSKLLTYISIVHWNDAGGHALLVAHNRAAFQAAFLDLARKLDVEDANGRTFLDNTLISWSQESGFNTHESCGTPLVTAGSAGGHFKTKLTASFTSQLLRLPPLVR